MKLKRTIVVTDKVREDMYKRASKKNTKKGWNTLVVSSEPEEQGLTLLGTIPNKQLDFLTYGTLPDDFNLLTYHKNQSTSKKHSMLIYVVKTIQGLRNFEIWLRDYIQEPQGVVLENVTLFMDYNFFEKHVSDVYFIHTLSDYNIKIKEKQIKPTSDVSPSQIKSPSHLKGTAQVKPTTEPKVAPPIEPPQSKTMTGQADFNTFLKANPYFAKGVIDHSEHPTVGKLPLPYDEGNHETHDFNNTNVMALAQENNSFEPFAVFNIIFIPLCKTPEGRSVYKLLDNCTLDSTDIERTEAQQILQFLECKVPYIVLDETVKKEDNLSLYDLGEDKYYLMRPQYLTNETLFVESTLLALNQYKKEHKIK